MVPLSTGNRGDGSALNKLMSARFPSSAVVMLSQADVGQSDGRLGPTLCELRERERESVHCRASQQTSVIGSVSKLLTEKLTVDQTSICRWPSYHSAWRSSLPDEFVQQHRVDVERRETLSRLLTVPPTSPSRPAIPGQTNIPRSSLVAEREA